MTPITYPEIRLQLKAEGVDLDTIPAAELVDEVAEILFAAKGVDLDTTTKSVPPFPYLDRAAQLWNTAKYVALKLLEEGA